jgi:hypothetical protein
LTREPASSALPSNLAQRAVVTRGEEPKLLAANLQQDFEPDPNQRTKRVPSTR